MALWRSLAHYKGWMYGLARFCYYYIHFVNYTSHWKEEGKQPVQECIDSSRPIIFVFWHGRLSMMPLASPKNRPMNVLISHHRDGGWIARVMHYFGFDTVRGSSRKGGVKALMNCKERLLKGENVSITPDGPRGPRMRVQGNVIALAQQADCPIIPVSFSTSLGKIWKSWDSFLFPFPFGKAIRIYGEPLYIPSGATESARNHFKLILEERLNSITHEADLFVKRSPVIPASLTSIPRQA